ncbi:MAG: endonuclease/exonuclease/phosphatase family protein [Paracoccaceae bacterium]
MFLTGDALLVGRFGIYMVPWLAMIAGLLAAIAHWISARRAATVLGAVCIGLTWAQWPEPSLDDQGPDTSSLSIITLSNRTVNVDMAATAAFLKAHPADIVALQEVADPEALLAHLSGQAHCRDGTSLILSRFPLGQPEPESTPRQLFCTARTPLGPILIGSVHMPKARFDTWQQDGDLARLVAVLETATLPVVLAGDFNATPLTTPYRRVRRYLEDAHARAGWGLGMTFPTRARPLLGALGPFLRIDYVFHGPELIARSARVLPDHPPGADHLPLRAELILAER